jgi:hypothetical protein
VYFLVDIVPTAMCCRYPKIAKFAWSTYDH